MKKKLNQYFLNKNLDKTATSKKQDATKGLKKNAMKKTLQFLNHVFKSCSGDQLIKPKNI